MSLRPHSRVNTSIRDAFGAAMAAFKLPPAKIAVAVSGGGDSMALLHLLREWCAGNGVTLHALTVDHCLRDAAADEAAQVAQWCLALEIPHTTLRWEEGRTLRGQLRSFQNEARDARYGLLTAWCAAHDVTHLFVGHHADDQIETFLLRLSRGSGVDGLAAMACATVRDGILVARPLLGFAKTDLLAVCREAGQAWIEDPSNENTASARVRFRQSRALLAREGLTDDRLLSTIAHLQRAKAALDFAVTQLLTAACTWDELAVANLDVPSLRAAPEEVGLRALARVLAGASGQTYGPRFEGLGRLYRCLTAGPWQNATLHGAVLEREGSLLRVFRESAALPDTMNVRAVDVSAGSVVWDGRFRLTLADLGGRRLTVRPLTPAVWRDIAEGSADSPAARVPARVRATLPAVFDSEGLVAVPHAVYLRPGVGALGLGVTCISASHTRGDAEL